MSKWTGPNPNELAQASAERFFKEQSMQNDPRDTRLRAMEMANGHSEPAELVVRRAQMYADFILGKGDAEIAAAAKEFAQKITTA